MSCERAVAVVALFCACLNLHCVTVTLNQDRALVLFPFPCSNCVFPLLSMFFFAFLFVLSRPKRFWRLFCICILCSHFVNKHQSSIRVRSEVGICACVCVSAY